jgi:beta-glucanase (GH16 family)
MGINQGVSGFVVRRFRQLVATLAVIGLVSGLGSVLVGGVAKASGTSVPSAPSAVVAAAGNSMAALSWTAPSQSGSSAVTGYFVTAHLGSSTDAPLWFAGSATTATVNGLANGSGVQFTVVAANASGDSPASGWSNYVTPSTVPSAPTNVTATPAQGQINLNWTAAAGNGAAVTGYVVTPYVGGVAQTSKTFNTATSQVIYSLSSAQTYSFTVTAFNGNGDGPASTLSNAVSPTAVAAAPSALAAVAGNNQATLTWTAPATNGNLAISGYDVTAHAGSTTLAPVWFPGTTTTGVMTGLANGTGYQFTVLAVNADGSSPASGWSNYVTPSTVPSAPTNLTAVAGYGQATVTWTAPAANGTPITRYVLTASLGGVSQPAQNFNTATTQTIYNLPSTQAFTYTLAAVNADGTSPVAASTTPVTATTLASAPGSMTAVAGSGNAAISWTAPTSTGNLPLTGYYVTSHTGSVNGTPVWFAPTVTSTVMTGLVNNTGYQFTVVAVNADGNSPASAWSNYVTPSTVPNTPTGISATGGDSQAIVWWTVPAGTLDPITQYVITPYIAGVAQTAQVFNSTVNAQTVTGLSDGTGYQFTVTAVNTIGNSVTSALTNTITPAADPTTFDDEFNAAAGSGPNAGLTNPVWYQDNCWTSGCGNNSPTQYLPSNVYQDGNGNLVLQAGNNPTSGAMCGTQACTYTGAGIQMHNTNGTATWSQEYGTFSARIKVPAGSGLWPAFWLAGSNSNTVGWPACGEIDTLEADGSNTTTVQQHIHYGAATDNPAGAGWTLPAGESTTDWHTYSVTWTPSGIVWDVDGTPTMVILATSIGTNNYNTFFSHPFSVILDLTVGGTDTSTPNTNTTFPSQMLVDYIRATQT